MQLSEQAIVCRDSRHDRTDSRICAWQVTCKLTLAGQLLKNRRLPVRCNGLLNAGCEGWVGRCDQAPMGKPAARHAAGLAKPQLVQHAPYFPRCAQTAGYRFADCILELGILLRNIPKADQRTFARAHRTSQRLRDMRHDGDVWRQGSDISGRSRFGSLKVGRQCQTGTCHAGA